MKNIDSYIPTHSIEQLYQAETRASISRSQAAEAKRSIAGMKQAYITLKPIVVNRMLQSVNDMSAFAEAQEEIKQLEDLKSNIEKFEKIIEKTPVETPKRTTHQEQKEIRGLYETGKYLEDDLAEQYSLTQGGINKILNRSK
jgi:CRISPR/Cas system endoribonuclease Cas6 (RAMP superfamily)